MTRLHGGANNVVARVVVDGRALVAKLYFQHPGDPRDRLHTEFATLSFLWRNGVRSIPEPVAVDRDHGVALYELVDGSAVEPGGVTQADAMQLADLLTAMWGLRAETGADQLPVASEAFFEVGGYLRAMEARLHRVRGALADAPGAGPARAYVEDEVVAFADRLRPFVEEMSATLGLGLDRELPAGQRTLSPADFGFHNVLRRVNGELVFLDFEYAGWDDPAVMLAQACLAPAVPLPDELRPVVVGRLLDRLGDPELASRLRVLYPLVAFKWSLIVLNGFLPVSRERRAFAGVEAQHSGVDQIRKSRLLLGAAGEAVGGRCFLDAFVPASGRQV